MSCSRSQHSAAGESRTSDPSISSVCHTVMSVSCSRVVTCWEKADLLAFLCVMSSCVFVTFPYGLLCQVWYLIVSITDLYLLPYFN